ncbi:MAG: SUMF1/EgtB/PvdO family nonheme iron enzyme [Phycisphaeraceae bacterium]
MPAEQLINSLGMRMVPIPRGSFTMGQSVGGEFDERPTHRVALTRGFHLAGTQVTNAQYEQFDPRHRALRGNDGLSSGDDQAVIQVSWADAEAFCRWLSQREKRPYRLPTEAEWEYACRAGTQTPFWTGDDFPKDWGRNQKNTWTPAPVNLTVGTLPANGWGLYDMHGNVEEWCSDWYGPYALADQTDPTGPATGQMKVTRGGSHNTTPAYLRSANRSGALPADRNWLIGFRVVLGPPPAGQPTPPAKQATWAANVSTQTWQWTPPCDMARPWFGPLRTFVRIPAQADGPLYARHNHCPSVTWCDNGDLLAIWFSTRTEEGREMTIAAGRLRAGAGQWDPAAEFFKAPDRNMTGSALFNDGQGTLYHFNGLGAGPGWGSLALVLRQSRDQGVTWTACLIDAEHGLGNQVISGTLRTRSGALIQACDAVTQGHGGTVVHISRDDGKTWSNPAKGQKRKPFVAGGSGPIIAGIHAGIVELADGRLMALGRGDSLLSDGGDGRPASPRMPMSLSGDLGQTWTYQPSVFGPIWLCTLL